MRGNSGRRRELRKRSTQPERLLWAALRDRRFRGLKFRRQYGIGRYITDFACVELKLVIELDGGYHEYVEEADRRRQQFIEDAGFKVLRFTNEDVMADVEAVLIAIGRLAGLDSGQS